jgi:hypothetical protein
LPEPHDRREPPPPRRRRRADDATTATTHLGCCHHDDATATVELLEQRVLMAAQPTVDVREDELVVTRDRRGRPDRRLQTEDGLSLDMNGTTRAFPARPRMTSTARRERA